jgi:1,4-alpha-glucan branching enzyme
MAKLDASDPASRNGSKKRKPLIKDADVSRFVDDFPRDAKGSLTKSKVHVCFNVKAGEAKAVSVAGTFNHWDPKGTPLDRKGQAWEATIELARGKYEYRFIVDGQWISDPNALESIPNPYGSRNSVLSV